MEGYAINPYFEDRILAGDAPMTPTSNPGDVQKHLGRQTTEASQQSEKDELKEAAEHSYNVILHLNLDGTVRWVSPSWDDVIGTSRDSVLEKPISSVLLEDQKKVFERAVESMTGDNSRSHRIRFALPIGPNSRVPDGVPEAIKEVESTEDGKEPQSLLEIEAQGILIYDRKTGDNIHTMWVLRPFVPLASVTVNLPPVLVDSLGVGAPILAQYLKAIAENGVTDNPPDDVLCRICERKIPPWWFEKHSELCFLEHKAESEVQLCQENLTIHRTAIVRVLDAMERQPARVPGVEARTPPAQPEYRGFPIGSQASPSGMASPHTPPRSRESSTSGFRSSRDFRVRRPQARIVELLLDLCDTAIEISTPAINEAYGASEIGFRTQSPGSESRITQVLQWRSPATNTLEQERGLALLCEDTESIAKAKVEAVIRHRHTIEFSERLRIEFSMLIDDCISEAVHAAALAREDIQEEEEEEEEEEPEDFTDNKPGSESDSDADDESQAYTESIGTRSLLTQDLRSSASNSDLRGRHLRSGSPADHSGASASPRGCTPRSQRSRVRGLQRHSSRYRSGMHFDGETGAESDASGKSSLLAASNIHRTDSPISDHEVTSRLTVNRDRSKRSSFVSPRSRQASPARGPVSSSPLRILKPRISSLHDSASVPTPITSPLLSTGDFSPAAESYNHHRRQSSVTSGQSLPPPPLSPRLPQASASQPRAVAPSIKDFEIVKPISKGAFGSVYLSKKKSTGDYFAIKVLKKADMIAKNQVTNVRAERAIMMVQGESDFVAKLYWTFASKDYLYLVMEYLNGGDCGALIKALGGLPEEWSKKYIAEVILGLEHLHSRGIVHRDLKPDNLLIDQKGHLKLTDFGLSRMGLLGRQKRAREANSDSTPDLLNQGPFLSRSKSVTSSRSTSFDYPGASPSATPLITPSDQNPQLVAPSYFSLSRESSRRGSNPRSEPSSVGVEGLSSLMSSFSITDGTSSNYSLMTPRSRVIDDDSASEMSYGSNEAANLGLSQVTSNTSSHPHSSSQQTMMPPPMALFDPEDSNRKFVGTPDYLAPETIRGSGQDEMSDWWSLGCILFEFLYGYPPFNAETHDEVFDNILNRRIDWPDDDDCPVSPEAKDLMNRLMCTDQTQRIGANGAEEVKSHPWFKDLNWETLLQETPSFIPAPQHPEDTDYFDSRGAAMTTFEEFEDQGQQSPAIGAGGSGEYADRPHDAISRVRKENSSKRGLVPLSIPPHVREGRGRRLSEPNGGDDFGTFTFKNLTVLEKANKDVIQRLRTEAMKNPQSTTPSPNSPADGSPTLNQKPLARASSSASSKNSGSKRPSSPSSVNNGNSGSNRGSQPSSPLMVSFSNNPSNPTNPANNEKRKPSTSSSMGTSSVIGSPSGPSIVGSPQHIIADMPRLTTAGLSASTLNPPLISSAASSPIRVLPRSTVANPSVSSSPTLTHSKTVGLTVGAQPTMSPQGSSLLQRRTTISRGRSMTVGSDEGQKLPILETLKKNNRRSQVFDMSPSSSDNEDARTSALLRVQRKRHSSRRMSTISIGDVPMFRPLDVLVCEDHPVSRMVMERLLEKVKCRVIAVDNGTDAMRYAMGAVTFDIILMEFKLPQVSGQDVARMIRETDNANSRTPIVVVTGYVKDLTEPHHFDALLEKPLTQQSLTAILEQFCNWRAPPAEKTSPGDRRASVSRTNTDYSSSGRGSPSIERFSSISRGTPLGQVFAYEDDSPAASSDHIVLSRSTTNEWEQLGTGKISPRPNRMGSTTSNSSEINLSTAMSLQGVPSPTVIREDGREYDDVEEAPKKMPPPTLAKRALQIKEDSAQMLSHLWGKNRKNKERDDDKEKEKDKDKDKEKSDDESKFVKTEPIDIVPKRPSLERAESIEHLSPTNLLVPPRDRSRSPEKKPSKAKSIADFVMRAGKRTSHDMKRSKSNNGSESKD